MTLLVEISIEDPAWAAVADLDTRVEQALTAAWNAAPSGGSGGNAEVSCLFCDDATIQALNRQWRGKDKPTNVLSFPAAASASPGPVRLLGDIAVAFGTLEREAEHEGKPLEAHLSHLLIHGLLHLVGHDHETPDEADAMEALETRILAELGLPDPYAHAAAAVMS